MGRGKLANWMLVAALAAVVMTGCTSPAPETAGHAIERLLTGKTAADTTGAVTTPAARALTTTNTLQVGQPASINIAAGADVETQINEAVYQKVNPSVVYIENLATIARSRTGSNATVPESSGSGLVWDMQGHIVTNNHVVEGAEQINVTFADGVTVPADIVATDAGSDLAVIKVDPSLVDLVPAEQGDIASVKVGGRAIAIGNPFGLVGTMTTGIVSALGRSLSSDPTNGSSFSIPQVIQTDAAINPGNSGGPLLNEAGQVIGVNFQIRSEAGSNSGVGFAIPINIVQRVVPALIDNGAYQHAYLGIRGQTYSPAWAEALNFPKDMRGAYVTEVTANGPAARGGLQGAVRNTDIVLGVGTTGLAYLASGGDLITAIDGQTISTFDDLLIYLENNKSPGDKVTMTVLRSGGSKDTLTITLGARPTSVQ